jgi:hypothetical protein
VDIAMDRNLAKDANRKAKQEMQKAVGKVIKEKKEEPIGTKETEEEVAADLNESAQQATQKLRREEQGGRGSVSTANKSKESPGPRTRPAEQFVTQITVIESDPDKQAEALTLMMERARFMERQPGFISISVHTAASMVGASSITSSGRAASYCGQLISRRRSARSGRTSMS